ncbi:cuticle protein 19-like [Neocloeon triangulifer]|uniref:cuticle protein 19-like n=1 Tax=Neocloeon triangulifer TaxID=2078957 RepID=UPI00286F345C|nr:cuticle protein 19-like [Neocloeon triangulifer]
MEPRLSLTFTTHIVYAANMSTSQQMQVVFLVLAVAATHAYPPSFGRYQKKDGQEGGDSGLGSIKKGQEALSAQHAVEDDYHKPSYKFEYTVSDPHTGDLKKQWEHREGGVVKGLYSLVEPDGSLRTVHYEADPKTGFHATVHKTGVNKHPAPTKKQLAPAVHKNYFSAGFGGEEESSFRQ